MSSYENAGLLMRAIRAALGNATGIEFSTQAQFHALFDYCDLFDKAAEANAAGDDAGYYAAMDKVLDHTQTVAEGLADQSITIVTAGGDV